MTWVLIIRVSWFVWLACTARFFHQRIKAVFVLRDPIWALFFAVLNTSGDHASLRNACWVVARARGEQRSYFFSVNKAMLTPGIWTEGMLYILPGKAFEKTDPGKVRFDEWAAKEAIRPIAKMRVAPADFPFLDRVAGHPEGETIFKLCWLYKRL